jgi:hypothetical protein
MTLIFLMTYKGEHFTWNSVYMELHLKFAEYQQKKKPFILLCEVLPLYTRFHC